MMDAGRAAGIRNLGGLKNISWLSSRQLNRLAAALMMSAVEKREIIIEDNHRLNPPTSCCRVLRVSPAAIARAIAHW
jgi:hypothetical protein